MKHFLIENSKFLFKYFIVILFVLISSFSYSQSNITAKEGFYYLLKVSNVNLTERFAENFNQPSLKLRWVDLYFNLFDKTNYDYYSKDEFKWPEYSRKTVSVINSGLESADFNKLFSYKTKETLGKYNFDLGGFPIIRTGRDLTIFSDEHTNYNITLRIGYWVNKSKIDLILKMDSKRAEKLVEFIGESRKVDLKVIYNVVNNDMSNLNSWNERYLGINVSKLVIMNGSEVLGEIIPRID